MCGILSIAVDNSGVNSKGKPPKQKANGPKSSASCLPWARTLPADKLAAFAEPF